MVVRVILRKRLQQITAVVTQTSMVEKCPFGIKAYLHGLGQLNTSL